MAKQIVKIEVDPDLKGLSILVRDKTTVEGIDYFSEPTRRAFRKEFINENDELVINQNFSSDIDSWTGETDFLTTKFNF